MGQQQQQDTSGLSDSRPQVQQSIPINTDVPRQEVQQVPSNVMGKGGVPVQALPLPSDEPRIQQQVPINTSIPLPLPLPTTADEVPPPVQTGPTSPTTSVTTPIASSDDFRSTYNTFSTRTSTASPWISTSGVPSNSLLPSPPTPVAQTSAITPAMQLVIGLTVPMFLIVILLLVAAFVLMRRQQKQMEHQKRYMEMAQHIFLGTRAFPAELPANDISR